MNIIRKLAVRSYKKELIQLTDVLSTFSEEKVATFLIYSVWLRSILQNEGHINPIKHLDPSKINIDLEPELHAYPFMLKDLENTISFLDKQGETSKSSTLGLWVHTLRSIIRPELNDKINNLWELIMKSKRYWNEKLEIIYKEDIQLEIEKEFVENTLNLSEEILKCLPPKQIYQNNTKS